MKTNKLTEMAVILLLILTCVGCNTSPEVVEEREVPISYYLTHQVVVDKPIDQCFDFITHRMPEIYTDMAEGHISYEIVGGAPMALNGEINCWEEAGPQRVHNHYVIEEFIPNEMIYFLSQGSRIYYTKPNGEVVENESHTHCYYDFVELSSHQTELKLTVVIEMPNRGLKLLGSLFGSKRLWNNHLHEELNNLDVIIEQRA